MTSMKQLKKELHDIVAELRELLPDESVADRVQRLGGEYRRELAAAKRRTEEVEQSLQQVSMLKQSLSGARSTLHTARGELAKARKEARSFEAIAKSLEAWKELAKESQGVPAFLPDGHPLRRFMILRRANRACDWWLSATELYVLLVKIRDYLGGRIEIDFVGEDDEGQLIVRRTTGALPALLRTLDLAAQEGQLAMITHKDQLYTIGMPMLRHEDDRLGLPLLPTPQHFITMVLPDEMDLFGPNATASSWRE